MFLRFAMKQRSRVAITCAGLSVYELSRNIQVSDSSSIPWVVGKCYFIRTVTMHTIGRLVSVGPHELVLEDAAWIADSGRWSEALANPSVLREVEPFLDPVIVGRGAIVDATEWRHDVPLKQK
jgi:hypothetical protein